MFGFSLGPKSVSVAQAYERLGTDGHCLIDVRSREEVRAQGVDGALHIPLERLESEAPNLKDYTSIHVMCRSGGRSGMAANLLHGLGLTQVENVTGGLMAWEAAGLPTK